MLAATLILASMHGLVRLLSSDLHPFVIVFFRNVFGFLAILPLLSKHGLASLHTKQKKLHAFRAVVGITAMLLFFYGLSKVPLANATALSFSTTLFATISAALFLKEVVRIRRWLAIAIGLCGIVVVLQPNVADFNRYSLLLVLAAIAWGTSVTIVKKLTQTETSITVVGLMSVSLSILSTPFAVIYWQTPTMKQLTILLAIGAMATVGHLLMTEALKRSEVGIIMSVDFSRLIWTALIGIWFFNEPLQSNTVVGAVIIFGAGWYIIFRESRLIIKTNPTESIPTELNPTANSDSRL